jgi:hypothetical protein
MVRVSREQLRMTAIFVGARHGRAMECGRHSLANGSRVLVGRHLVDVPE